MKKTKHIGVRFVLSWIVGVFFLLAGAMSLLDNFIGGLLIIFGAVLILPPFGEFVEKKYHYHLSGWLKLVLFLLLVGIGISLTSTDEEPSYPEVATTDADSKVEKTTQIVEQKMTTRVLEKRTFDQVGQYIGETFLGKKASGTFLVLTIEVQNNDDEPIYITSNDIQLFDKEGRKFIPDTQAMLYAKEPFVFETINPGITKKGVVIFDVPDGNAEYDLQVSENVLSLFD